MTDADSEYLAQTRHKAQVLKQTILVTPTDWLTEY